MKTLRSAEFSQLSAWDRPLHIAIGMFDGLHVGHQSVIHSAFQAAQLDRGQCGILTFHPHPSHLFRPDSPTPQIYAPSVKEELLRRMGLDLCLIQFFTGDFAKLSADEFVTWICNTIPSLASVSVGENFRFGKGRVGDPALLVKGLKKRGISVFSCERIHLDGKPISSTLIRSLLGRRPIEEINHLLGRPYLSIGVVKEGKKLGCSLGFPTLNLPLEADIYPQFGVYLVRYQIKEDPQGIMRRGVANFGLRPTMENSVIPRLEIHSLDECPAGYGSTVVAEWIKFLRPEKKFENLEALKTAIRADREKAWALLDRLR